MPRFLFFSPSVVAVEVRGQPKSTESVVEMALMTWMQPVVARNVNRFAGGRQGALCGKTAPDTEDKRKIVPEIVPAAEPFGRGESDSWLW